MTNTDEEKLKNYTIGYSTFCVIVLIHPLWSTEITFAQMVWYISCFIAIMAPIILMGFAGIVIINRIRTNHSIFNLSTLGYIFSFYVTIKICVTVFSVFIWPGAMQNNLVNQLNIIKYEEYTGIEYKLDQSEVIS